MEKWSDSKFEKAFKKDKRKALKSVYTNNKILIKDNTVSVPITINISIDQFRQDIKDMDIKESKNSKVIFINEAPDVCCHYLTESKHNVCVLNCADALDPGGLYTIGYETPEEELCRTIPALYNSLKESKAYPFNCYTNVLYTPDLLLYRNSKDSYNRYKEPPAVSVISAAAPKLNQTEFDKQKVYDIMKMIFYIPKIYDKNKTAIIISAYGCSENPKRIAKLFKRLIGGHKHVYKVICFSFVSKEIHDIFKEVFQDNKLNNLL